MEAKPCNIAAQEKNNMTQCALKITHIGEVLFAAVLNKNPKLMKMIAGKKEYTAVPEAIFTTDAKQKFDGEHKIDVLLLPKSPEEQAIPIELKLGKTRMKANKSEFGRFLTGYRYSEKYHKFTGSMISILSKKQAEGKTEEIRYPLIYNDTFNDTFQISDAWRLIVLTEVIANELRKKNNDYWGVRPPLGIFSFQQLFERYENLLNTQVKELIKCENYYEMWLKKV